MDIKTMAAVMGADHRTMSMNDIAPYLFLENRGHVYLDIQGLQTSKDLYCFLFDLFCKGLVLLYGDENQRVYIELMTYDQFATVAEKMKRAGIHVYLDMQPLPANEIVTENIIAERRDHLQQSTDTLVYAEPNLPLKEYVFELKTVDTLLRISFDLVRLA